MSTRVQPDDGLNLEQAGQPGDGLNLERVAADYGLNLEQTGQPKTAMKTEQVAQPASSEQLEATPGRFDVDDSGFEAIERVRPLFSDDPDRAPEAAEIEKDSDRIIAEPPGEDAMFAELSEAASSDQDGRVDQSAFPEQELEPARAPHAEKPGGLFELDGNTIELPPAGGQTYTPDPDVNDDVVDLYALGAVDYDPAVHY
jgi:hypothetical protein